MITWHEVAVLREATVEACITVNSTHQGDVRADWRRRLSEKSECVSRENGEDEGESECVHGRRHEGGRRREEGM